MTKENYSKKLYAFFSTERKDVLNIYFYAILSGLVSLSVPLGIQAIVNYAFGATMATSIYILIGLVTVGTFLTGYFQVKVVEIIEKIQQKIFVNYALAFAEKIPKIDLTYSNQYYLPEIVNRFFDTQNLQKGVSKVLLELPVAVIQIFFGLILLSFYHPYFIVFSIFVIIIVFGIFKFTRDQGIETSLAESEQKYEVASWLEDISRDIKSFKNNAFLQTNTEEANKKLIRYLDFRTSHFKILLFQYKTIIFFKVLITFIMLLLGTFLLINQKLSIGAFIATEIVVLTIMTAVEKLIRSLEKYYDIITSLTKLSKVLEMKEDVSGSIDVEEVQDGFQIKAQNVSFGFQNYPPLLNQLNFSFPKNKVILITGEQGSGKSVLMNLISGLFNPISGNIYFDDIPISNYQQTQLRKYIGLYSNDLDLVKGTVLENINLGNHEIGSQHIIQLLKNIGINNFVESLSNGLLTKTQSSDKRLSYSSKKLILLLRAFVGKKRLLVLEDPLDGFNQEIKRPMKEYIQKLSLDRTIIIIGNIDDYSSISEKVFVLKERNIFNLK